ncbi:MAG: ABC transporter ATP-binding protein [Calditrichaeota bacterium]|nr:MAG: ABC transporter ATP-binding protein [Calditrichota bacterium]
MKQIKPVVAEMETSPPPSSDTEIAIALSGVRKAYARGALPVLDGVDLTVLAGERIGLVGANGSGKTTLLRLVMNFLTPDEGEIVVWGESSPEKARRFLGFVPEHQEGLENFTPRELLSLAARMYGMPRKEALPRIEELLAFARLTDVADRLVAGFSKGMVQRLQIALALIHSPRVLLLDEPMSGLDPSGQQEVGEMLFQLQDYTLIYASHHLEEIEAYCTAVVFLHRGQIIHKTDLQNLDQEILTIDVDRRAVEFLQHREGIQLRLLHEREEKVRLEVSGSPSLLQSLLVALADQGITVERLRSRSVLEELYQRYVVHR